MSLYQGIKEIGKKALLVGGLVAALSGCDSRTTAYKTSQIFRDLNGDGKPEHVYMVNTGKDVDKTGNTGLSEWYDFDLMMQVGKGEGVFEDEKVIHRFPSQPSEVKFEDVTGDGKPDLVYLISTLKDVDKTGNTGLSEWYDFDLMMRENKGDGSFGEPKLVQRFPQKPSGLH